MPLVPSQMAMNIRICAPLTPPVSPGWVRLTEAIGLGVTAWATANPINLVMVGATAGTLGAGAVTGKIIVPPAPPLVIGAFVGAGIVGIKSAEVATAISLGVSQTFTQSGMYMGPAAGTSSGVDVSKVIAANAPTLIGFLQASMAGLGMFGVTTPTLATAIGNGVALNLMLGFGTGVVAPIATAPLPGVGVSPLNVVV